LATYWNHFSKKNTTIINSKFLISQLLDKSEFEDYRLYIIIGVFEQENHNSTHGRVKFYISR